MTLKNITPRPSAASTKRPNPPTVRPAASGNPHERRGPSNATTHPTENRGTDPHFLILPRVRRNSFLRWVGRRSAAPCGAGGQPRADQGEFAIARGRRRIFQSTQLNPPLDRCRADRRCWQNNKRRSVSGGANSATSGSADGISGMRRHARNNYGGCSAHPVTRRGARPVTTRKAERRPARGTHDPRDPARCRARPRTCEMTQ